MTDWPFDDLRPLSQQVILADPPWYFANYSAKGEVKNPVAHYACMDLEAIKALPVDQLATPDCALFLWATWPMLREALAVMDAWRFTYKTGGSWQKRTPSGKAAFGTGYILRTSTEPFLFGTIGAPRYASRSERNAFETVEAGIDACTREHSRKPDAQYEVLERLFPHGNRCELFARARRPGWSAWGDQVGLLGGSH